jgi:molecular chaperone HtpG
VADIAELLLAEAQILDGLVPDDPAAFARRLNRMVVRGVGGG